MPTLAYAATNPEAHIVIALVRVVAVAVAGIEEHCVLRPAAAAHHPTNAHLRPMRIF